MSEKWFVVYARLDGDKCFRAFDIREGQFVGRVMYASMIKGTIENKKMLQEISNENRHVGLKFQLRNGGYVVFQTK